MTTLQINTFDAALNSRAFTDGSGSSTLNTTLSTTNHLVYNVGDALMVITGTGLQTGLGGSVNAGGTVTGITFELASSPTTILATISNFTVTFASSVYLANSNVFNLAFAQGTTASVAHGSDVPNATNLLTYVVQNGTLNSPVTVTDGSLPVYSLNTAFAYAQENTVLAALSTGFGIADTANGASGGGYTLLGILNPLGSSLGSAVNNFVSYTITDNATVNIGPNNIGIPNATMLGKLHNLNGTLYTVNITAGGSDIVNNIDLLETLVQNHHLLHLVVGSVGGTPTFTIAKAQTDSDALHLITKAQGGGGYAISDTAANFLANADTLNSWATTDNVTFSISTTSKSFAVNIATWQHIKTVDTAFLAAFTAAYAYNWSITDTAANIIANASALNASFTNISSVNISDTAANVAANLDALQAARNANYGFGPTIFLTDPANPISVTLAQYAYGNGGALSNLAAPYSVTLNNGTSSFNNYLWGSLGGLTITGSGPATFYDNNNNDTLTGGSGNDTFNEYNAANNTTQDGKNNVLNGGGGVDRVAYDFASTGALTHNVNGSWTVTKPGGYTDTLTNVEFAQFSDQTVALREPTRADFNGDGKSDMLWQNSDGSIVVWSMSGTSIAGGGSVLNPGASWKVIGTGDFNSDGRSDIILQNMDGSIVEWLMNGAGIIGGGLLGANPGPSWRLVGTGDFNGDGNSDMLLQNTDGSIVDWFMNGTGIIGGGQLTTNPGASWQLVCSGNFNGDGTSDMLFQNADGSIVEWNMNGTKISGGGFVVNPGADWKVVNSGDFNGDGKSDLVLQNTNGQIIEWFMSSSGILGGGVVGANPGPTWHVMGTRDYNADGLADLLLQNDNGSVVEWFMNGTGIIGGGQVSTNPGASWKANGN